MSKRFTNLIDNFLLEIHLTSVEEASEMFLVNTKFSKKVVIFAM
jgi:hypothetical protein